MYMAMWPCLSAYADSQLNCSDHLTASVSETCSLDLSADHLIVGDYDLSALTVVYKLNGIPVDLANARSYLGKTLVFEVHDLSISNFCWGTITIEDKIAPTINCGPCTDENNPAPECILRCPTYELFSHRNLLTGQIGYSKELLDKIIPSSQAAFTASNITDNCGQDVNVRYVDGFINGDCSSPDRLIRTWTISYETPHGTESQSCTQHYFFEDLDFYDAAGLPIIMETDGTPIEDHILMPHQNIIIPECSLGHSPADIAAYFDDPDTEDLDSDGDGLDKTDCVIENNEGVPYAYPHFYMPGLGVCPTPPPGGGGTGSGTGSGTVTPGASGVYPTHPQPVIDKVCNINVTFTDAAFDACQAGCGGNVKISRQWSILNWCDGASFEYLQNIEIRDAIGPEILVQDFKSSVDPWHCASDVLVPAPEHLRDNCDEISEYEARIMGHAFTVTGNSLDGYKILGVPPGIYQLAYEAQDCCGNWTREVVELQVMDSTGPIPVTIENIVVELTQVNLGEGTAKVRASDIDNGSYDSCGPVELSIRREFAVCNPQDTVWGDEVTFCCADFKTTDFVLIDVQFRVVDWLGNENLAWSTVRLEDKVGAKLDCPADRVLDCDQDFRNLDITGGIPRIFTSCGQVELVIDTLLVAENTVPFRKRTFDGNVPGYGGVEVPAYNPACGFGAIRKTFDQCVQWIVVESTADPFDASTIEFPEDMLINCLKDDTGEPDWEDAICNLVGFSLESDTFNIESNACLQIINEWTVIDWCRHNPLTGEGAFTHTQIIEVNDDEIPSIITEEFKEVIIPIDCATKGSFISAVADDTGICTSPWLGWRVEIDMDDDLTIDYVYDSSFFPSLPNGEPNPFALEKTSSGYEQLIILPDGLMASKKRHRVIWFVDDGCRNRQQIITYFTLVDAKAPTPLCLNLGSAVMQNGELEIWAIDFDQKSFDNCTAEEDLLFTFTDVPPPPRNDDEYNNTSDLVWYDGTFWYFDSEVLEPGRPFGEYMDQDDYGEEVHLWDPALRSSGRLYTVKDVDNSGFIEVPIYVWDDCLNVDFCTVRLRVLNNGGGTSRLISGQVTTENDQPVSGIMTSLMTSMPEFPKEIMTGEDGHYSYADNPDFMDYEITGGSQSDYLNGVSTVDLIMIQRHILGIATLDSPYKMIAADINSDNKINGVDLVELRKLILGIYTELPQNDSWILVDKGQYLDVNQPWVYREAIYLSNLFEDRMEEDFIGVKIGDVNNDVVGSPMLKTQSDGPDSKILYLDMQVESQGGQQVVTISTAEALSGLQMEIELSAGVTVDAVRGGTIEPHHYRIVGDRVLVSLDMSVDNEVLQLVLNVEADRPLSDMVKVDHQRLTSEAYGADLISRPLELRELDLGTEGIILHQNSPNPFTDHTFLIYELDREEEEITITFYDQQGRLLRTDDTVGYPGMNHYKVNGSDLHEGLIYYQVCLLYTSPSPRDATLSRMPSSA